MSMRTVLHDRGGKIHISVFNQKDVVDSITAKVYRIDGNPEDGLFIMPINDRFNVPERKFGRHREQLALLTGDYDRVGPSIGAMMVGLKGSGKSMLAEDTCNWAIAKGLPVFLIESAIPVGWLEMVSAAVGPAVFYFDEFGKSYRANEDMDQREALLGFFSSSTRMGSMYLVTGNSDVEFSEFMINRPGRFRFRFRFTPPLGEDLDEVLRHHHVDAGLWPMIHAYCLLSDAGYDVLNSVLPMIRQCKTPEEVYAKAEVYNIPRFPDYGVIGFKTLRQRLGVEEVMDVRIRTYQLNGDMTRLSYRIDYPDAENKNISITHNRQVDLTDLAQYQVPLDSRDHGPAAVAAYEFPDADGEALVLVIGWSPSTPSRNFTAADRDSTFEQVNKNIERKAALCGTTTETIDHSGRGHPTSWSTPHGYLSSKHHL